MMPFLLGVEKKTEGRPPTSAEKKIDDLSLKKGLSPTYFVFELLQRKGTLMHQDIYVKKTTAERNGDV